MGSKRIITGKRRTRKSSSSAMSREDKPQVEAVEEGGQRILRVTVTDPILGKKLALDADLLALAAAVIPSADN